MTDAERARKSRARRSDAAERIEVTFWPISELSGALASMSVYIGDHPGAADAEVRVKLEQAMDAIELISIALWDGSTYGRRRNSYIQRYGYANFLSKTVIDHMRADHMKRLEEIATRAGALFIRREARAARERG